MNAVPGPSATAGDTAPLSDITPVEGLFLFIRNKERRRSHLFDLYGDFIVYKGNGGAMPETTKCARPATQERAKKAIHSANADFRDGIFQKRRSYGIIF